MQFISIIGCKNHTLATRSEYNRGYCIQVGCRPQRSSHSSEIWDLNSPAEVLVSLIKTELQLLPFSASCYHSQKSNIYLAKFSSERHRNRGVPLASMSICIFLSGSVN